jgi:DNA-binding transcriptional ArsR family regulator
MSQFIQPRFSRVAAAIGDPTRSLMLSRLLDGRYYTAKDLANHAGVTASTASQHLKVLVDERLAQVRAQGWHRYFMLADGNVATSAHALEALLRVADGSLPETRRRQAPAMRVAYAMHEVATDILQGNLGSVCAEPSFNQGG